MEEENNDGKQKTQNGFYTNGEERNERKKKKLKHCMTAFLEKKKISICSTIQDWVL